MSEEHLAYLVNFGVPVGTFILGFFASRLTMTKKERKDYEQEQYNNALNLSDRQKRAYNDFVGAIRTYMSSGEPGIDDFYRIATSGDVYFHELKLTGEAILSNKVDSVTRDQTLIPALEDAAQKSIPEYYRSLQEIARKKGFDYDGDLKRNKYESIYGAVEKYGSLA